MNKITLVNGKSYEVTNFRESYRTHATSEKVITFQIISSTDILLQTLIDDFSVTNLGALKYFIEEVEIVTYTEYTTVRSIDKNFVDATTTKIDVTIINQTV